jgi:hypothetical protein
MNVQFENLAVDIIKRNPSEWPRSYGQTLKRMIIFSSSMKKADRERENVLAPKD